MAAALMLIFVDCREKHEERKRMGESQMVEGVFPNAKIAKKLNEWLGPPDPKPTSPPIY